MDTPQSPPFPLILSWLKDALPTIPLPSFPPPRSRPSRVSGNPQMPCHKPACLTQYRRIPAYAGRAVYVPCRPPPCPKYAGARAAAPFPAFCQNCPFSKNRKKLFDYLVDIIFSGLITSGQFSGRRRGDKGPGRRPGAALPFGAIIAAGAVFPALPFPSIRGRRSHRYRRFRVIWSGGAV